MCAYLWLGPQPAHHISTSSDDPFECWLLDRPILAFLGWPSVRSVEAGGPTSPPKFNFVWPSISSLDQPMRHSWTNPVCVMLGLGPHPPTEFKLCSANQKLSTVNALWFHFVWFAVFTLLDGPIFTCLLIMSVLRFFVKKLFTMGPGILVPYITNMHAMQIHAPL